MTTPWLPRPTGLLRLPHEHPGTRLGPADADLLGDHLWCGRVAADVVLTPADRARDAVVACGVATLLGRSSADGDPPRRPSPADGGTVCLLAAAWIRTGGPPPRRLDVTVPRPVRARFGPVRYRTVVLRDRDVVVVGGVRVTSPLTTACDLARDAVEQGDSARGPDPAEHAEALRRLVAAGVELDAVRARLMTANRSRARQARAWLDTLDPLPERSGQPLAFSSARPEGTGAASGRTPVTR